MRVGAKYIVGQLNIVINRLGVKYLRDIVAPAEGELLTVRHPGGAIHIDTTLLPLRQGLLVYNQVERLIAFKGWDLRPHPTTLAAPADREPPLYLTGR